MTEKPDKPPRAPRLETTMRHSDWRLMRKCCARMEISMATWVHLLIREAQDRNSPLVREG